MKTIEYFFSPVSPWAYLGHERLIDIAQRHKAQIEVIPIELGTKIFPVSGGLPLAQRAVQRQSYRLEELARWRDFSQKPLNLAPQFFPVSDALANEFIAAAQVFATNHQVLQFSGAIMKAVWADQLNVADLETLNQLAKNCSIDLSALEAARASARTRLDANNERAKNMQVFGAPWYRVDGSNFWGQDRLDFVERAISL